MTLILTAIAAALAAAAWRFSPAARKMRMGTLVLAYAGAALMWCVDEAANLLEGGALFNLGDAAAMADDAMLGVLIVAAGFLAWLAFAGVGRLKALTA